MSKAVMGIAVVALVVALVALGGVAYTYFMVTQAIHNQNNGNNNQQTTVTVYSNSQNGGCTSNCNSQTTGVCTNCGNGTNPSIVTVISGTTASLYQCQGSSGGQSQTYTTTAANNNQCYLSGNQVLTFSFVAQASGLSASGSFQSQANVDVKFTDVTASQTLNSQTQTTSTSFNVPLTSGHSYVVQFTNDEGQNNVLTLSFSIG